MNYWPIKRNISVMLIASLRTLEGELLHRERLEFIDGQVINYSPNNGKEDFEGSIELEAFANDDLVIPYIAMMVYYEAPESVSMVHAYARTYTLTEIEDGNTYSQVEESGLVVRDNSEIRSCFIFHNGAFKQPEQACEIQVTNQSGETRSTEFKLKELKPYETVRIYLREHVQDLTRFLANGTGSAAISLKLNGGFSRGLCVSETLDGKEMQVYHSNFNYSKHHPGTKSCKQMLFMFPKATNFRQRTVHLDPFMFEGQYVISDGTTDYILEPGQILDIAPNTEYLTVRNTEDTEMPTRVNLTFEARLKGHTCRLPLESARNFYAADTPLKYHFWSPVAIGAKHQSQLIVETWSRLHGPIDDSLFEISLYLENTHDVLKRIYDSDEILTLTNGAYVEEIFPETKAIDADQFGYLYCRSSAYGGHQVWSTIESNEGKGSASIEHSF
jgi:hypothetical protein